MQNLYYKVTSEQKPEITRYGAEYSYGKYILQKVVNT